MSDFGSKNLGFAYTRFECSTSLRNTDLTLMLCKLRAGYPGAAWPLARTVGGLHGLSNCFKYCIGVVRESI